jgi:hypothetical protein
MEAAASYRHAFVGNASWEVYAGAAGEPALGPPAYPHRLSAMPNPLAPVGHHWLDSTHITFGVFTTAVYTGRWKVEGSLFNGREPDEQRADFDFGPMDSYSGRLSFAPTARTTLQVSAGHLREAEQGLGQQPRTTLDRGTASVTYHRPVGSKLWATTVAWGVNSEVAIIPDGTIDQTTHAVLAEASLSSGVGHTWFGRVEVVGKPAHALHAHEFATRVFTAEKVAFGYIRHLPQWRGIVPGIGGMVMTSVVPPPLAPRYGGRVSPGFGVFLSVMPPRHSM